MTDRVAIDFTNVAVNSSTSILKYSKIILGITTLFTIEPPPAKSIPMPQSNSQVPIDPALLRAAKDIYTFYCQVNPDRDRRRQPIGVAMNKLNYRGKLIFSSFPILLPEEHFISIDQLEN
jgi:hypothetical protein